MICPFLLLRNLEGRCELLRRKRECFLCKVRPSFDKIRDVYRPWHPFCVAGAAISGLYRKRIFPPLLGLWIGSWDLQRPKDFFHLKIVLVFLWNPFLCKIVNLLTSKHIYERNEASCQIRKLNLLRLWMKVKARRKIREETYPLQTSIISSSFLKSSFV